MRKIKRFNEMYENSYNYESILKTLKNEYNWGNGVLAYIDDFESNDLYFNDPLSDNEYVINFNVYLTDIKYNQIRGKFKNNIPLKLGNWKLNNLIDSPISIYNKLY